MRSDRWLIYEQHAAAIRRFVARRVEPDAVDDVVAETFAIAWRRLPREADPLPWLYAVAGRVMYGHFRGRSRRARLFARLTGAYGGERASDPAELIVDDPVLARAFATLGPSAREAIRLVAWEGLTNQEAAAIVGCSAGTFAVRYSRARTRLATALERETAAALVVTEAEPA
jgi:RNA polymerase sigma-70 factor (ECF subfamily)